VQVELVLEEAKKTVQIRSLVEIHSCEINNICLLISVSTISTVALNISTLKKSDFTYLFLNCGQNPNFIFQPTSMPQRLDKLVPVAELSVYILL